MQRYFLSAPVNLHATWPFFITTFYLVLSEACSCLRPASQSVVTIRPFWVEIPIFSQRRTFKTCFKTNNLTRTLRQVCLRLRPTRRSASSVWAAFFVLPVFAPSRKTTKAATIASCGLVIRQSPKCASWNLHTKCRLNTIQGSF